MVNHAVLIGIQINAVFHITGHTESAFTDFQKDALAVGILGRNIGKDQPAAQLTGTAAVAKGHTVAGHHIQSPWREIQRNGAALCTVTGIGADDRVGNGAQRRINLGIVAVEVLPQDTVGSFPLVQLLILRIIQITFSFLQSIFAGPGRFLPPGAGL